MTSITVGILILAIIIVGLIVFKKVLNKGNQVEEEKESIPNETEKIYTGILSLNIAARDNGLDKDCLDSLEKVFDKVLNIAEEMNKPENYSEMTVPFNRMHSKYIPSILNPYMALNCEDKLKYKDGFINKLTLIEKELNKITSLLESQDKEEFQKMGKFVEAMFPETNEAEVIFK